MPHAAIVIHGSVVVRSLARVTKYVNQQTLLLAIILALVTYYTSIQVYFSGPKIRAGRAHHMFAYSLVLRQGDIHDRGFEL